MLHIENRKTTIVDEKVTWARHDDTFCECCNNIVTKRRGGHKTKKKSPGRPKTGVKMWTRKAVEEIIQHVKLLSITPSGIPLEGIINTKELDLCKCNICHNIISQPVMSSRCLHIYCYTCIVSCLLGKTESDGKCPVCAIIISFEGLIIPNDVNNLLALLVIQCTKCKHEYNIYKYAELQEHEAHCVLPNSPFLLKDVFDLDETSEIPRVAQDACLHYPKDKNEER